MTNDPHVLGYADRIAEALRTDRFPNRLTPIEARLIGSRYGVDLEHREYTIKEASLAVAEGVLK